MLRESLTEDELHACIEIRASAVDKVVSNKTEKGGKKKAIEAMKDALKAAGALTMETTEKLLDLRVKE